MTAEAPARAGYLLARLALLMAFASIATDLYLPALPRIAGALGAPLSDIEFSVASFLAGFVAGQLVWGPVGDHWGRKRPMGAGVALFLVASAGCALAGTATALAGWRLLQGFGGAAAVVLARATIRDLYQGNAAARALSSAIALMALAPLAGPLIGAQILRVGDWRAIFWTLCALSVLALMAVRTLPETRPVGSAPRGGSALAAYRQALASLPLLRFAAIGASYYAGMFAFITSAPAVFIARLGFSPSLFGALLALGTALIILANLINMRLIRALGYVRALQIGSGLAGLGGAGVIAAGWLAPAAPAPLVAAIMVYMAMAGLVVANSLAGALDSLPELPGAASALAGAAHFAGGGLGAALAAALVAGEPAHLGWLLLAGGAGAFALAGMGASLLDKSQERR